MLDAEAGRDHQCESCQQAEHFQEALPPRPGLDDCPTAGPADKVC
jgi:hypothetical protein